MKSFLAIVPSISILLLISVLFMSCSSNEPMDRLDDIQVQLVNQNNEEVRFPTDLKGEKFSVFGFLYTHCPDICPLMVANMKRVELALGDRADEFNFYFTTFDPARDSVDVMRSYFDAFRLESPSWTFMVGSSDGVDSLTKRLGFRVEFQPQKLDENGQPYYLIDHTDKVSILNEKAQLVAEFNASRMTPSILARELLKLKDEQ